MSLHQGLAHVAAQHLKLAIIHGQQACAQDGASQGQAACAAAFFISEPPGRQTASACLVWHLLPSRTSTGMEHGC